MLSPASNRRQFLSRSGLALLGTGLIGQRIWAETAAANAEPLFKISLAEWSLHRTIGDGKLSNLDFPRYAKEKFGIEAVEYVSIFFERGEDNKVTSDYLKQLKQNCEDNGVQSVLIMVDNEGALGDPDDAARQQAVENHRQWLDAAKFLGCHAIRVNARSDGSPEEQHARVVDGLSKLGALGAEQGLKVIVENHGGLSSNGAWLAGVMKELREKGHENCGTLPDFGNFHIHGYDTYQGIEETMPYAYGVSAKSNEFDSNGNEAEVDYERAISICLNAGYHGHYGIEWEGGGLSEDEGIIKTRDLLLQLREKFTRDGVPAA